MAVELHKLGTKCNEGVIFNVLIFQPVLNILNKRLPLMFRIFLNFLTPSFLVLKVSSDSNELNVVYNY